MSLKYFYWIIAAILGINAVVHLFSGNMLRAVLSAALAAVLALEASGRPTLGRLWRTIKRLYRLLRR